ncbi:alpha-ketoacid dehydrogenase subunit beta [Sphingosinicella soli]|uniref:Pyruvate dehydrogenase E1 component beta subunit n=1 Tax=Sphingosinicella soli TaxID=333708 RepID=A0A7W7B2V1_9SPHN|nr:alpha-ketoacid dehydrogenase subunit beta [Sphingosinicella soli]MBB4631982.1 pyruvate dehydrogenase E1 component beta subunit [Sphingosinicella soli]
MSAAEKINILQAVNLALADAMADDVKVVVLGEDVGDPEGGGVIGITRGLSTRFGEARCRSTPIAEQAIIGAAIGASLVGYKPVAEIMLMNFTAVAMDMIVNHAAKLRYMSGGQTSVPIVIRTMTGAGFSSGGQHSDYVEGWFAHTAGMKVVAPSTAADAYGLMRSCIDDPDPCLFIENIPTYWLPDTPPESGSRTLLGQAKVTREGTDVTIVSYSRVAREALAAAEALSGEGISAEVIDLRTISPWDKKTVLASVAKTKRAIVAHEALRYFGPGGEIASTINEELFSSLKAPVSRLGAPTTPVPFSKPLEDAFMVGSKEIVAAAKALVAYK